MLHGSAVMPFAVRLQAFAKRPQTSAEGGLRFLKCRKIGVFFPRLLNRHGARAFDGEFSQYSNALANFCFQLCSLRAGLFCTKHITDEMPKSPRARKTLQPLLVLRGSLQKRNNEHRGPDPERFGIVPGTGLHGLTYRCTEWTRCAAMAIWTTSQINWITTITQTMDRPEWIQ